MLDAEALIIEFGIEPKRCIQRSSMHAMITSEGGTGHRLESLASLSAKRILRFMQGATVSQLSLNH